jgi:hypothetical protein
VSPADRARAAAATRASVERDTDAEPRRMTPTERLHELAMAHATRPLAAPEHSCDLTRNAKGQTQIALTASYDALRMKYPLPSGYVGAEGEPQSGGAK